MGQLGAMNMNLFSNQEMEAQLNRKMWIDSLAGSSEAAGIDKKTARKYMNQFLEYGVIDEAGNLTPKARKVFKQMGLM
jgi:hypothetical protein